MTTISLVVAIARNGVIGREGDLPWRQSTDLKRFKAITLGKPIVMGRKTWESFPKRPLPGRENIVISRDISYDAPGASVVTSLGAALTLARTRARCLATGDEICVVGGGQVYAEALPLADRLHVTHVEAEIDGDTRFPAIDAAQWIPVSENIVPAGEKDDHATRYVVYERRRTMA